MKDTMTITDKAAAVQPLKPEIQQQQHTPGPWHLTDPNPNADGSDYQQVKSCKLGSSAMGLSHDGSEEGYANARLIAAAPELLAALRNAADALEVRFQTDYPNESERTLLADARAAIAKATGQEVQS